MRLSNLSKTLKGLIKRFLIIKTILIPSSIPFVNFLFKKSVVLQLGVLAQCLILFTLLFTNDQ